MTLIGFAYSNYVNPPKMTKLEFPHHHDECVRIMVSLYRRNERKFPCQLEWMERCGSKTGVSPESAGARANLPIFYARQFAAILILPTGTG
ncbi:MAG: hypothetical protein V8T87_06195 [Victivallales bacterium]